MSDPEIAEKEKKKGLFRKKNPDEMTFLEHLEALRWHLIRSVIMILAIMIVAFLHKEFIFDTLILGPVHPGFWTYRFLCSLTEQYQFINLCISKISFNLMNTELSGQFNKHITVSFMIGLTTGFPYLLWELWRFIKPGLTRKETRYANGIVLYSSALFAGGVLFGYYFLTPMSINFLGSYQVSRLIANQITLSSYISTVTTLTLAAGLVFELPIVVYFLSKIGIMTPQFMRRYRKHAIVVILILSAILTPSPDIPTQMLLFVPLYILYEISIFISAKVAKNKP